MRRFRRELPAADFVPISAHVDDRLVRTRAGDYVQVLRLKGTPFECADVDELNNWHERLNVFARNIASPNLALWSHVIRRRDHSNTRGELPAGFARDLGTKYARKMSSEVLMVNELYLSLVYRPSVSAAERGLAGLLKKTDRTAGALEMDDAIEHCNKLREYALASLDRYDPEPLGLYEHDGRRYSTVLEFYGLLINGERQRMPAPRAALYNAITTSHQVFGTEAMEYRTATETRYGAMLGVKEYPAPRNTDGVPSMPVGVFSDLLRAPFPFVLTQSFAFVPKGKAETLFARQERRLGSVGDDGGLRAAIAALKNNEFVVGEHHFSLHVLADAFPGVKEAEGAARLKHLTDNVAAARALLADTGMVVARENLALKSAFWAQLPGNFSYRTRTSPITSRNFAAMSPFYNYPTGRERDNHWGDPLTMFVTNSGGPYHFSLHASDPRAADGGSRRDVGHSIGIGPTGGGKTTAIGFLVAQAFKFGATQVIFDKDEGLHTLTLALGGEYLSLKDGKPTGCNPFQAEPTASNIAFWRALLRAIVGAGGKLTQTDEQEIEQGIGGLLGIKQRARWRLSRLVEFIDPRGPEGVHARLLPWCEGGPYGWVLDNPTDQIEPLLGRAALVGFDVTDFLNNPVVRRPLMMYLFHLIRQMLDGRPFIAWVDEFARLLDDEGFPDFAKDALEGWRKKNACFVGLTQMASHVTRSKIAASILEQCPTKFAWPNPAADFNEYTHGKENEAGFGFSLREFLLIKQELEPGSRQFLVKQGRHSVVAGLDLKGFGFELDVISGRAANLPLMHRAIAECGREPGRWLPRYRELLGHSPTLTTRLPEEAHA